MTLSRGGSVLPKKVALLAEAAQPALIKLAIRSTTAAQPDEPRVIDPISPMTCGLCFQEVNTAVQSSTRLQFSPRCLELGVGILVPNTLMPQRLEIPIVCRVELSIPETPLRFARERCRNPPKYRSGNRSIDQEIGELDLLRLRHLRRYSPCGFFRRQAIARNQTIQLHFRPAMNHD